VVELWDLVAPQVYAKVWEKIINMTIRNLKLHRLTTNYKIENTKDSHLQGENGFCQYL